MKLLKPIIASMMLAGVTFPVFAADDTQAQLDSMKAQLAKMEAVIKQNQSGGFSQTQDWYKRITISGLINADGYVSNKSVNSNKSSNALVINNASLFADAAVNEWTTGHVALFYGDDKASSNLTKNYKSSNNAVLDEAYVTIGNFSKSPIYFRAGKEYVPFGTYERFPLVLNATQLLTETSGNAAQLGFVLPAGFYGSVYGIQGLQDKGDDGRRQRVKNGGANLGYAYNTEQVGFKFDVGYINNMADVNFVSNAGVAVAVKNSLGFYNNLGNPLASGYTDRVGGVSLGADLRYSMFDFGARYVTALKKFNANDISSLSLDPAVTNTQTPKPSAYGLTAGVTFPVMAHQSRFGLGYQHTKDASKIGLVGLPQNRYYGEYAVNISKWTDVGVALVHDRNYSQGVMNGGSSTTGIARLSVKFA